MMEKGARYCFDGCINPVTRKNLYITRVTWTEGRKEERKKGKSLVSSTLGIYPVDKH